MEFNSADFSPFFSTTVNISLWGGWLAGWELSIKSKSFKDHKSQVVRQLVGQLPHSGSADNNLVLFHLWWRELC